MLLHLVSVPNNLPIFFDEPEQLLHPQFQKKFFAIIKEFSKKRQIFIATHSPYFIDPHSPSSVFRFEKNIEFGTKIYKMPDDFKKSNGLYLENREIFFADQVVLIE